MNANVRRLRAALVAGIALLHVLTASAQTTSIALRVSEGAGIRRNAFPVTARVPMGRGVFGDATPARLLLNGVEVPVQTTPTAHWPDGSVQWLDVDFNASPGPTESLEFVLEYGSGVVAPAAARGLIVSELGDAIQIGNVRINRLGTPLIASVKYRDEAIGAGVNGFVIADATGTEIDLASAADLELTLIKRGPLVAALRYTGTLALGASKAPFVVTVEMPSSKSWVKLSAQVDDPARQVKSLALAMPLALGPLPWVWDFGTSRWTYGQLRNAGDSVVLTQTRTATASEWRVTASANGRDQIVEASNTARVPFAGWTHVQGQKEVVAFAVDGVPGYNGEVTMGWSGSGQGRIRLAPAVPATRHTLTVYEHFVSTPVQIGAATAPPAILSPLSVTFARDVYTKAGLSAPRP